MPDARCLDTSDHIIGRVLRQVNENCARPDLALNLMAKKTNVSSRHLGRLFQKHTGQSFRQYLRHARMQRAAELLTHQAYDVKMVAALIGYSSRTHFDQDFRAQFGCTPSQFKKAKHAA